MCTDSREISPLRTPYDTSLDVLADVIMVLFLMASCICRQIPLPRCHHLVEAACGGNTWYRFHSQKAKVKFDQCIDASCITLTNTTIHTPTQLYSTLVRWSSYTAICKNTNHAILLLNKLTTSSASRASTSTCSHNTHMWWYFGVQTRRSCPSPGGASS